MGNHSSGALLAGRYGWQPTLFSKGDLLLHPPLSRETMCPFWSLCTLCSFTRMPCESYRRKLGSLLLCSRDVFRALINSIVLILNQRSSRPYSVSDYVTWVRSLQVGKTALAQRFLFNRYDDNYTPTIEDFHRKVYRIRGVPYRLDILDTSGIHPFPAMRRLSFITGKVSLYKPHTRFKAAVVRFNDTFLLAWEDSVRTHWRSKAGWPRQLISVCQM